MQILIRTGLKGLSYNIFLTPVAYEVDESVWQAQQVVRVMSCPHSQVNSGCNQESPNHVDGVENSPPDHTVTVRDTGWGLNCAAVQEKLCSCGTPAAEIHLYYIMAFLCSTFRDALLHTLVVMGGYLMLLLPSCQLKAVLFLPADLCHQQDVFSQMFSLFQQPRCFFILLYSHGSERKQQSSS